MTSPTTEYILNVARYVSRLDSFPIFCGYVLMVLLAGQWKKFFKPLNLRPVLVIYNLTASAISFYTLYGSAVALINSESTFSRQTSEQLQFTYKVYWFAKTLELLDTVFMVLRHKQRQISFLHVYHHSSMLLLSDMTYHSYPYVAISLYLGLNSAVHVLLYLYYGLSALHPENPPQWKEFLTQFQITQFVIDLVHATIGYMFYNYCIYGVFYCIAMIILFSNFYIKAYSKQSSPSNKRKGI
ncbi:elongation of very long chain fatty acids protein 5-like [Ruditapes philippinarum]|uniref:elongation of very long chain fatty acids protein 5-like n=1 Tax=Ruditapes philippinarum TaxID=129788 RepID=UPI00295BB598|nr:elongation of very long chain fatty acids protein 5-like [Ruditapes philippinarum]